MRYSFLLLTISLLCVTGVAGQTEQYAQQLRVVQEMLAEGNYRPAAAQARGLATAAREAQLTGIEAEATLLHGLALSDNPRADAGDRVDGIQFLRRAALLFRKTRNGEKVDTIVAVLERLTGSGELIDSAAAADNTNRRRRRLENLPSADSIDERALEAIVDLQSREIMALTDSQLRQVVLLEQQGRLLDDYAFQALEDSLELVQQDQEIALQRVAVEQEQQRRNFFILLAVASILLLGLVYLRFRSSRKHETQLEAQNAIIAKERERSDELLLNILPAPIAEELKEKGRADARYYERATIMFVDFKGFSTLAKQMAPERLIEMLDEAFQALDRIVAEHDIEKIKTIGDAYMCASGLPLESEDHAERCVRAGLAIQEYLTTNPNFSARIGIHTGPVVAGVVGLRKFVYDVWGDTVNQAARLETAGKPGLVAVSETTKALLGDDFTVEAAGTFEAKNIGPMLRYFVRYAAATSQPDPAH